MVTYFTQSDIASCAQHIEVKKLANKLYNRWENLGDKLIVLLDTDTTGLKLIHSADKAEKIKQEFDNIIKALNKCCL